MKTLIKNEFYKVYLNKWFFYIMIMLSLYFRFNGVQYINGKEAKIFYPLTVFSNIKQFIYPFLIIIVTVNLVAEEFQKGTISSAILQGYNIKEIINSKLLTSIILNIILFLWSIVLAYIVIIPEVKNGISLNLYSGYTQTSLNMLLKIIKCEAFIFFPSIIIILLTGFLSLIIKDKIKTIVGCVIIYTCSEISISILGEFPIVKLNVMYYLKNFFYTPKARPEIVEYMKNPISVCFGLLLCILCSILLYILIMKKANKLNDYL